MSKYVTFCKVTYLQKVQIWINVLNNITGWKKFLVIWFCIYIYIYLQARNVFITCLIESSIWTNVYLFLQDTLLYIFTCNISLQCFRHKQRRPSNFYVTDATLTLISTNCPLLEELILVDKSNAADGSVSKHVYRYIVLFYWKKYQSNVTISWHMRPRFLSVVLKCFAVFL